MDAVLASSLGLVGGLVLTPVVRSVALALDIVDRPGELKPQRAPVAYLGGVAVLLASSVGPLLSTHPLTLVPMVGALVLGLADDIRPLAVRLRIVVEVAVAIAAAWIVPGPVLAQLATAALVLGLLNAVNLLDGQDGLCAGVGAVISLGFATLGGDATPIGLALGGSLIGFLALNRPPARIYLGDAGAYLVGTTLALLPALSRHGPTRWSIWWAVPLLVAMPVIDTTVAIARRLRMHRPLLSGDRSHVYDQLVDRGLSIGTSTIVCVAVQLLLTAVGLAAARAAPAPSLATTVVVAILLGIIAWRTGLLTITDGPAPPASDG